MLARRNEAGYGTNVGYICVGVADSPCFLIDPQPECLDDFAVAFVAGAAASLPVVGVTSNQSNRSASSVASLPSRS